MAEIELRGYLTCGKYNVNDYTIEINRATDGMVMKITDGDGNVKEVKIADGKPGMTEAEKKVITDLLATVQEAYGDWTEAEKARAAAEKERKIAESGADGKGEGSGNRKGLYKLMKALYESIYPKLDNDLAAVKEAKTEAVTAATQAKNAAEQATAAVFEGYQSQLFYTEGDKIEFVAATSTDATVLSTMKRSPVLNAHGYIDESRKVIMITIPVAKLLTNITGVECSVFKATIVNDGGKAKITNDDFQPIISQITIDKVQNCLHVEFVSTTAFSMDTYHVNCIAKDIKFVLHTTTEEGTTSGS